MDTLTQVQQGPHQARGVRAAASADARPGRRAEAVTQAPSPPPPAPPLPAGRRAQEAPLVQSVSSTGP